MLLGKKLNQNKADPRGSNSVSGSYIPKETRLEQKRAFVGAHFQLGDQQKSKCAIQ